MTKKLPLALLCLAAGLAAPHDAAAEMPLLSPVYLQISNTETVARAIDKLSDALAQIYARSTSTVDEQTCRKHKRALLDIVAGARSVQAGRSKLARTLSRLQQNPNAGALALGDFSSGNRMTIRALSEMSDAVEAQSATFHAAPQIASSYDPLQTALGGSASTVRKLREIHWDDARNDAARPQNPMELLKLDSDFRRALVRLRVAVDHLDGEVSKPCPPVAVAARSMPGALLTPGQHPPGGAPGLGPK